MRNIVLFLFLVNSMFLFAQRSDPDSYDTNMGSLKIHPVLHGTIAFEWNNQMIYVDPYNSANVFNGLIDPNLIFITDIHGDHLNQSTLDALNTENTMFIVPQAVAEQISKSYHNRLVIINNGEETEIRGVKIRAIPMYNLPENEESRHVKGRGNGYLLSFGETSVYISGDTEDIREMRNLKDVDIAFVCMNLPYTMDVEQAADAVLEFKPKIVYPYHYRGKPGLSDVEKFKEIVKSGNKNIEVKLRNWYPTY